MTSGREFYLPSQNGKDRLHLALWEPSGPPRAILQISHGMCEHILRYGEFGQFLADQGFVVIGNDHLGHGKTAASPQELGYFDAPDPSRAVVEDLHLVSQWAKENFPGLPLFLLGHSMGSFLARRYAMTSGEELAGAIFVGTGRQPQLVVKAGLAAAKVVAALRGPKYRSQLLYRLSTGDYDRQFEGPGTWLSRNTENVAAYGADPLCQFQFTVKGYQGLLSTIHYIQQPKHIAQLPAQLPILLVSGAQDPVGDMGKGVAAVYRVYRRQCFDVTCRLYRKDRHEILNEVDRAGVYRDILRWLEARLPA